MAEKKMVNIYIPKDKEYTDEKAKRVYINDKCYSIPVGKNVEVPVEVAQILTDWMENLDRIDEEREERIKELEDQTK